MVGVTVHIEISRENIRQQPSTTGMETNYVKTLRKVDGLFKRVANIGRT